MAVTLTEKAARHVLRCLEKNGQGIGLRIGIQPAGCAGMTYQLDYVNEAEKNDVVFESNGVSIFIAPEVLPYLDGTELDYVREGFNEKFRFNNPNVQDICSCGDSFRV